ncbi:ATP-dependent sacrificial sulfur transferase LarE [Natranaerobius thermophilus]|uniref:ExsB family protein n=1 Tax=Natranaerobius thermophilus (strain ATCC BAA-1301 / DSM 18059 / JW/NM-WN-LF) TaxID=457570 RepID=B2A3I3_NATTJ|nr:ATP-dependent sacrificial sulfur transferase LarE [Natranaerobius thermophilus]ACB86412.1 ExsB family protein [Natranaerobius thermophilus JW/NM-WN-LF]
MSQKQRANDKMGLEEKHRKLKNYLSTMDGAVVAFSGGVDSTLLLKVAQEVLSDQVLAVTSTSETIPERELDRAKELAEDIGAKHKTIYTEEILQEEFRKNPPNRCYYCKQELFSHLWEIAKSYGFSYVLDGSNYDDGGDFRPGLEAAAKLQVQSPLKETGFTKEDVRQLSKELGLPTWNKPAMACLSSRFPYGEELTREKIDQVEKGEDVLDELGFSQFRLRYHGGMARLELSKEEFDIAIKHSEYISQELKNLGFQKVTLDLEGYRTGSMNEELQSS